MASDRAAVERGDARLGALAGPYLVRPDVEWGRMFSTTGLRVRGKVFGVVNHAGNLMVKVPAARAEVLLAEGGVEPMVMRGRVMREWVALPYEAGEPAWGALLAEAFAYLDEITPR